MNEQLAIQAALRAYFLELQAKNPRYSLRAYARKIDFHVASLSLILNGKRKVSKNIAEKLLRNLPMEEHEKAELLARFPEPIYQEDEPPRDVEMRM